MRPCFAARWKGLSVSHPSENPTTFWTGGQYSLYRLFLGSVLLLLFVRLLGMERFPEGTMPSPVTLLSPEKVGAIAWLVPVAGAFLSALLALGRMDRAAAWLLFFLLPGIDSPTLIISPLHLALVLHLFIPPAPYGSLAALGRTDPAGNWKMPDKVRTIAWLFLATAYVSSGLTQVLSMDWPLPSGFAEGFAVITAVGQLAFAPLALFPRCRQVIWGLAAGAQALQTPGLPPDFTLLFILALAFEPGWLKPPDAHQYDTVFYDGYCGLCHRLTRFLLAEDTRGLFHFAPLQGVTFREKVPEKVRADLPDSLVVLKRNGEILTRSQAALRTLKGLGGTWSLFARLGSILPTFFRDALYDLVAKTRFRIFGRTSDRCPVPPESTRGRFLP